MRIFFRTGASCALILVAGHAAAFDFTGGEVDLSYSRFIDQAEPFDPADDDITLSKLTLGGKAEVGFNRNFALQGDLAYHDLNGIDENGNTVTLHAILHYDDATSFGAFIGRDSLDGGELDYYGIEIGYEVSNFDVEVYVSDADIGDFDLGTIFGASGRYAVNPVLGVGLDLDYANADGDADVRKLGVVADYAISPSTTVYAELGSAEVEFEGASADEGYVEFGANFSFGTERGATFGNRGLLDLLPGS